MKKLLPLILVIFLITSCKDKDNFNSPKSLFIDYISSHTDGIISKSSEIKLRLAKPTEFAKPGEELSIPIFEFDPSINGKLYWEDERTVVFNPEEHLNSGSNYEVVLDLKALFPDISKDKELYKFSFQTLKQDFEAEIDGLRYENPENLKEVKLHGRLRTADVVSLEEVQNLGTANQNGNKLDFEWIQNSSDNTFEFFLKGLDRGDQASIVKMELDGSIIGIDKDLELEYEIPSIKDFKILSARLIKGEESYISILFSDPISNNMDISGLVSISGMYSFPRLLRNINEIKVYPSGDLPKTGDIRVMKSIKNSAGYSLKKDFSQNFVFEQIKPELKAAEGMEKTIIPASKGLKFPFQAVGLEAVDVIIYRVFPNNVLQYLQVNNLGGDYQLRRVARPLLRKTVPLNSNGLLDLNSWNTFSIDLESLIEPEAGAIYQVHLGFRKKHSLFFCTNSEDEEADNLIDDWDSQEESSYWDYSENYYSLNYNWQERDNPCSNSYYGARRSLKKIVYSSDLGIIAKMRDKGDLSVFLTNLNSTTPVSGVEVSVYDYQRQLVGSGTSDSEGKVKIKIDHKPYALIAKKGADVGYLKLDDGNALSMSNFDVSGNSLQNGLKGYIYGERGVWRPSDTIHIGFILEDEEKNLPVTHPVIAELYNPMNQLVDRKVSTQGVENMYRFDFTTSQDAPTGNYMLKTKVGGAEFQKRIKVETIKPNRLKINLNFDKEVFGYDDNNIRGDLNVRWLSGGKANGLRVQYELLFQSIKTSFDGYPNFSFDDASKNFYSTRRKVYDGRLDSDGNATINFNLNSYNNSPGALKANFYGTVYEEGGNSSISSKSIDFYPYSSFVGIKLPEGDKRGMLQTDKEHKVRIVTVDSDGNKVDRNNLQVSLHKIGWKWWWDKTEDNISNYVGSSYQSPIQTGSMSTQNGEGFWNLMIKYPEWGRYFLRVYDPSSGHSAGQVVYIDWPGWAGKGKRGDLAGASMLDFGIEKQEYNIGDEIKMTVPTTKGNRILVSLETGSEVIRSFWVEAEKEETGISFEANADMAPNVYVHLTMIQGHGQVQNDLPMRLYGIQSVKVTDPGTELKPVIQMADELGPEEEFTIKVSESSKKAMSYTLAVVDEGLLDITNFSTPNPWPVFYGKEALGIKTWDVYDDVVGSFGAEMSQLLAVGGDGEIEEQEKKQTNRFKPVVKYIGPFKLKAGESKSHKLRMPQYIGSVKTMVVASGNGAYGSAEKVTPVKQPLMILATLPRVAGPAEDIKLPVNIFMDGKSSQVNIEVETEGALKVVGEKRKSVRVQKATNSVAFFNLRAENMTGPAKVHVKAKSGSFDASYDVELEVIPRNPLISRIEAKVLSQNETWNIDYSPLGLSGENSAALELSVLPPLNIEKRLKYLIQYPHGCIEQTTSSVFAQLFLNDLIKVSANQKNEIQNNINAAIERLKGFQLSDGGMSYWPGGNIANSWGSNYAFHFLTEAKLKGYVVPDAFYSKLTTFQKSKANFWTGTNGESDLIQAYRLYGLAKSKNLEMSAMNRLRQKQNISIQAKWRLALAYSIGGYSNEAETLINGISYVPANNSNYSVQTFGSQLRDEAMILETLAAQKNEEKAFEKVMSIAKKLSEADKWYSTQTTAYSFIALAKYNSLFPQGNSTNINVRIAGNSSRMDGSDFVQILKIQNPDKKAAIFIENKGDQPVFAQLIRNGIPIEGFESAGSNNVSMNVKYLTRDGSQIDVSRLTQGTDFKALITIRNPGQKGKYNEMALTQIFPSGWEIVNTRLDGSAGNGQAEYIDFRDDRVMHYFDINPNASLSFEVLLQASYAGKYYLPAVKVEAMYDDEISANTAGKWIEVRQE